MRHEPGRLATEVITTDKQNLPKHFKRAKPFSGIVDVTGTFQSGLANYRGIVPAQVAIPQQTSHGPEADLKSRNAKARLEARIRGGNSLEASELISSIYVG